MTLGNLKICRVCKALKPMDEFYIDRSKKDDLRTECKLCSCQRAKEFRQKNPEKVKQGWHEYNNSKRGRKNRRTSKLKSKYNLTLEQHEQIYLAQDGRCVLCGDSVAYSKVHTDHDHKTGRVRGLLCCKCNMGLGFFGDSIEGLQRAIQYLRAGAV